MDRHMIKQTGKFKYNQGCHYKTLSTLVEMFEIFIIKCRGNQVTGFWQGQRSPIEPALSQIKSKSSRKQLL